MNAAVNNYVELVRFLCEEVGIDRIKVDATNDVCFSLILNKNDARFYRPAEQHLNLLGKAVTLKLRRIWIHCRQTCLVTFLLACFSYVQHEKQTKLVSCPNCPRLQPLTGNEN